MMVYSILVDLTRLSGLSRNQGDECRSSQSPRVALLAAAERSIMGVSRSAGRVSGEMEIFLISAPSWRRFRSSWSRTWLQV